MRYLPIISFLGLFCSSTVHAEMPIYAAYVSDEIHHTCQQKALAACQLNAFTGESLTAVVASLDSSLMIEDALSLSEYEVLIGNAVINIDEKTQEGELVFEITTVWRQVPIDDLTLRQITPLSNVEQTARNLLSQWSRHIQRNKVLEATKIYQVLGASDYSTELSVPRTIGDFRQQQSAVYRDPLLGSVTRYSHPRFDSAIVDISVYPFSPFAGKSTHENASTNVVNDKQSRLHAEMENELAQIRQSIASAKIQDYSISSIHPAAITVNGSVLNGLRLEVLLHTQTDPQYSTQYIFEQNDKVIKLTGNLPEFMMEKIVTESLPQIKVPTESLFMRTLRQG